VLAYADEPADAREDHERAPRRMLLWHANYHPDGGQLFFPLDARPYVVPLAKPGDDVRPEDFVAFRFDGRQGLYIHANVWHEGVFACRARSASSTSRARCTRASRSTSRASSVACSRFR
jgi:ureidoglycolate hydrolase